MDWFDNLGCYLGFVLSANEQLFLTLETSNGFSFSQLGSKERTQKKKKKRLIEMDGCSDCGLQEGRDWGSLQVYYTQVNS